MSIIKKKVKNKYNSGSCNFNFCTYKCILQIHVNIALFKATVILQDYEQSP